MHNFRQKVLSSLGWSITSQIGEQILKFTISVILARLLTPKDFGLVGMVAVFTGFAQVFSDLGLGSALVQRQELEERHYTSIFWLNLFAGFLMMCLVMFAAPWIADFYREPRLILLTYLVSINFFLGAFNIVQKAILLRTLNFKSLAIIQNTGTLIAGSIGVILAYSGYGPYALVGQTLIATSITAVTMWYLSDWRPNFHFEKNAIHDLWRYSSNLLGSNVLNYWIRNADNLLIGRFVGSVELGIYTRAYSTMLLPLNQVSSVIGRVMFPALSTIQADKVKVKAVYLQAIGAIALITFPMMLGLIVIADPFVLALFGPQWKPVVPVLQILSLVGLIQSITTTTGWIYTSQGRTDWQFRWVVVGGVLTFVAFGVGVRWGIMGVAIAYAVRVYSTTYINFWIPGRLINLNVSEVIVAVAKSFSCALIMAGIIGLMGTMLPLIWSPWLHLAIQVSVGGFVYVCLIHIFKVRAYLDLKVLFLEQLKFR